MTEMHDARLVAEDLIRTLEDMYGHGFTLVAYSDGEDSEAPVIIANLDRKTYRIEVSPV